MLSRLCESVCKGLQEKVRWLNFTTLSKMKDDTLVVPKGIFGSAEV